MSGHTPGPLEAVGNYPTRLDLCDGKYTMIIDLRTGQAECLRYGEPWRSLVGDKMALAMFDELVAAREQRDRLLVALKHARLALAGASRRAPEFIPDYKVVDAAIAKATGK